MPFPFKNLLLIFLVFTGLSLSLGPSIAWGQGQNSANRRSFMFNASFEQVWKATQQVLSSYPLELNNKREGMIKTQILHTKTIWQAPFEESLPPNFQQIMRFRFFKRGFMSTQMTIEKKSVVQKDFLGSKESYDSSGWEELRIYYLIRREIEINETLELVKVNPF